MKLKEHNSRLTVTELAYWLLWVAWWPLIFGLVLVVVMEFPGYIDRFVKDVMMFYTRDMALISILFSILWVMASLGWYAASATKVKLSRFDIMMFSLLAAPILYIVVRLIVETV